MKALAGFVAVIWCGILFAAEGPVLPARYLEDQTYFEGNWIGEGNIGDATVVIKFTASWVPGKHSLILHGTTRRGKGAKEVVEWTLLSGCDVSTQEMVDCSFGSDGTSSVTRWKSLSADEQVGKESGIQDGKPYSVECKAVKKGSDRWTFSSTTVDGKPLKIEYRREPATKTN
jgi:hypothetical protein